MSVEIPRIKDVTNPQLQEPAATSRSLGLKGYSGKDTMSSDSSCFSCIWTAICNFFALICPCLFRKSEEKSEKNEEKKITVKEKDEFSDMPELISAKPAKIFSYTGQVHEFFEFCKTAQFLSALEKFSSYGAHTQMGILHKLIDDGCALDTLKAYIPRCVSMDPGINLLSDITAELKGKAIDEITATEVEAVKLFLEKRLFPIEEPTEAVDVEKCKQTLSCFGQRLAWQVKLDSSEAVLSDILADITKNDAELSKNIALEISKNIALEITTSQIDPAQPSQLPIIKTSVKTELEKLLREADQLPSEDELRWMELQKKGPSSQPAPTTTGFEGLEY